MTSQVQGLIPRAQLWLSHLIQILPSRPPKAYPLSQATPSSQGSAWKAWLQMGALLPESGFPQGRLGQGPGILLSLDEMRCALRKSVAQEHASG